MVFETWLESDLQKPVQVKQLLGNLFSGDNGGNLIGVRIYDNGEPATGLSGNVYGYAILSNNATVTMSGTLSGNEASIILHEDVYKVIGAVSIVIKVGATTVGACTGYVYRTATETPLDPTGIVPDVATLLGKIAVWEAAAQGCQNVNITSVKSVTQNGNELSVTTTNRQNQSVNTVIREPEISATRSGKVVTITAKGTNATGNGWKTPEVVTITEPTMTITPNDGDFDVNINGVKEVTIPNPNKELSDRAHVETVSRSKTRSGNPIQIEDAVNEIADKMVIKLVPKQDLHGFSRPWVGGAGKNLLATMEAQTVTGMTTTVASDGKVTVSGTNNGTPAVVAYSGKVSVNAGTSYTLTGCPSGGGVNTYRIDIRSAIGSLDSELSTYNDIGSGVTFTPSTTHDVYFAIRVDNGASLSNKEFAPMLRLSSNTDATYERYSNICPISGYDTVTTKVIGKNLIGDLGHKWNNTTGTYGDQANARSTDKLAVVPGDSFAFSKDRAFTSSGSNIVIRQYKADGSYDSNGLNGMSYQQTSSVYTVPDGIYFVGITQFYDNNSDAALNSGNVQVERGSVVTEYEPPKLGVYPIAVSLATNGNQTAGTVYSGTVTLLADGSGQLVVDGAVTTCTGSEAAWGANATPNSYYRAMSAASEIIACNWLQVLPNGQSVDMPDWSVKMNGNHINLLVMFDSNYDTVEKAKALMASNNLVVAYKLDTPVTYTLTANQVQTLLGYNYIYTDGAEIALTYRQESLATNETLLKLLPTGTATGNPVTFSDGAASVPLKKLVVNVEPNQDLHGYEKPWVGGAGKNLLDPSTRINSANIVSNGKIQISTADVNYSIISGKVTQGTNYVISNETGGNGNGYCVAFFSDKPVANSVSYNSARNTSSSSKTFTAPITGWVAVRVGATDLAPQLEVGTTASAFEPFENICPIRGWDSVPLLRAEGIIKTPENIELGNIEADGHEVDSTARRRTGYTQVTENTKYTIEYSHTAGTNCGIFYFSGTTPDTFISYESWGAQPRTFTTPNGANYVRFTFQSPTLPTNVRLKTDNMKSYDISIPSEAGTVYGCQITLDENGEGELKVNRAIADFGNMTWNYVSNKYFQSSDLTSVIKKVSNNDELSGAISSAYRIVAWSDSSATSGCLAVNTTGVISCINSSYSDVASFKAGNAGVQLAYELATPLTFALTADQVKTLLGTNIISSDAGTVSVKYFKMLGEEQDLSVYAKKNNPVFTGTNFKFGGNTFSASDMDVLRILIDEWVDATGGYPVDPAGSSTGGNGGSGGIEEYAPVEPGTGGGSGGSEVAEEPAEP